MKKKWYHSWGMWSGILIMALAVYRAVQTEGLTPEVIENFLLGSGVSGVRRAIP